MPIVSRLGRLVRRAEVKEQLERAGQAAEVQRRQQEAEARVQCIFEDLERGIPMAELQKTASDGDTTVRARCSFDAPLSVAKSSASQLSAGR